MYTIVRDDESFDKVTIDPSLPVFCDAETCEDEGFSSGGLYGQIRLFQVCQKGWDNAILFDCFFSPLDRVLKLLQDHHLVFHGGAYDLHTVNLQTDSTWLPRKLDDTLYLSRMQYCTKTKFGFYDCLKYADLSDDLINSIDKKEEQKSNWAAPLSVRQKTYAAADVLYLCNLFDCVKDNSESTVYKLDIENLRYSVDYSRNGMPINRNTVKTLKKKYHLKLEDTLESLPVNPRSSKQCCTYLGTSSSAADVLTELIQDGNERAKKIKDARHYLKSLEYLGAYDRSVVKGFFQPCAALSGRFSCTGGSRYDHVNLQQMPEHLHSVVEAPEGFSIVYKDYSGLELRTAVAYTGEPMMTSLMLAGKDMHAETAKFIFNKEEISDIERVIAKTFNFLLIYGGGVKLAQHNLKIEANIKMSFAEVKSLIEKWFEMYDYFESWHTIHKNQLNVYGYVDIETALGRKVRTYKLTDSLNFPIQGTAVEVTKVSIGNLYNRWEPEMVNDNVKLINTIHDANILLAPTNKADVWGQRLSECMVDAWEFVIEELAEPDIPMPHGYETGPVWVFH